MNKNQRQDGDQHHQTTRLGVNEELGCRRDTRFTVEDQEHVDGKEHADNAAQDPHQVEVEEALVFFDLFPRTEYRQHTEQTGQHDHQQR